MKNFIIQNVIDMENIEEEVKAELQKLLSKEKYVNILLDKGKDEFKKVMMIEISKIVKKYIDKAETAADRFVKGIKNNESEN